MPVRGTHVELVGSVVRQDVRQLGAKLLVEKPPSLALGHLLCVLVQGAPPSQDKGSQVTGDMKECSLRLERMLPDRTDRSASV